MNEAYNWACEIVKKLKDEGYQAYFVGGCVRDMVMNRIPGDYDVATNASIDDIKRFFPKNVEVGVSFGVILVVNRGEKCQVSTFRSTSGNAEDDAHLRDFTINGLFYDPQENKVFDWVGGKKDIEAGIIRAINSPRDRFSEDYLRMIRAVRIASALGFRIEEKTFAAIKQMARMILNCSNERIRDELIKIFSGNPLDGFNLLLESGLIYHVIPELNLIQETDSDKISRIKIMLANICPPDYIIGLAALLSETGDYTYRENINVFVPDSIEVEYFLKKYKFSNYESKTIKNILINHLKFIHAQKMSSGIIKKLMQSESFYRELEFHRLRLIVFAKNLDTYCYLKDMRGSLSDNDIHPKPLLNGNDLIGMGFYPGKIFSKILRELELKQLEGELETKEDALVWIKSEFKK